MSALCGGAVPAESLVILELGLPAGRQALAGACGGWRSTALAMSSSIPKGAIAYSLCCVQFFYFYYLNWVVINSFLKALNN